MLNRNGIVSEKESGGWVAAVATSVNGCGRNAVGYFLMEMDVRFIRCAMGKIVRWNTRMGKLGPFCLVGFG